MNKEEYLETKLREEMLMTFVLHGLYLAEKDLTEDFQEFMKRRLHDPVINNRMEGIENKIKEANKKK
jgi:hypothetical protein